MPSANRVAWHAPCGTSGMDTTVFTVGERYANRAWGYEVLEINGPAMRVRSDDGQVRTLHVETAARLWAEMQAKPKAGRSGRKRGSPKD